uniref:Uncharacterized protein n=1 Tax=Lepeophtheirus salmonis TaxID=72036 RepID=A0A0K2UME1_LEPSM
MTITKHSSGFQYQSCQALLWIWELGVFDVQLTLDILQIQYSLFPQLRL